MVKLPPDMLPFSISSGEKLATGTTLSTRNEKVIVLLTLSLLSLASIVTVCNPATSCEALISLLKKTRAPASSRVIFSGSPPDIFIVILKSVPLALSKFNVTLTRLFGKPPSTTEVILVLMTEMLTVSLCFLPRVEILRSWKIVTFGGVLTVKLNGFVVFLLPAVSLTYAKTVMRPGFNCDTLIIIVQLPELFTAVRLN